MGDREHSRPLSALRCGECGTVRAVETPGALRRRLQDLGLICGTRVTCVGISPLGDPMAFRIRGAVIALRRADAETVRLYG
ncbi:MAG: ferrous iron transport protein A [Clostridia bacterium]|nr:ferrous iron transport protein A [Clostridia bacterium]